MPATAVARARALTQVVLVAALCSALPVAADTGTARVATLNTWNLNEPFEERVDGMIDALRAEQVDVVALQEVFLEGDGLRFRTDRRIADALGFEATSAPAGRVETDQGTAVEGLAVLSRWPILKSSSRALPNLPDGRPRTVLHVTIASPFGALDIFTTHLSTDPEERQLQSVELYRYLIENQTEQPPVLLGDLNTLPISLPTLFLTGVIEAGGLRGDLTDLWPLLRPGDPGFTFSTPNNAGEALNRRLDYIYVRGPAPASGEALAIRSFATAPLASGFLPSDHLGLLADLRFTGEPLAPVARGGGGGGCDVGPASERGSGPLRVLLILATVAAGSSLASRQRRQAARATSLRDPPQMK